MLTLIISILPLLYCLRNIIDIRHFTSVIDNGNTNLLDAMFIILTMVWLIVQVFLLSGPLVLITILIIVISDVKSNIKWKTRRRIVKFQMSLVVLIMSFIIINKLYLNISMWDYLFKSL